MTNPNSLCSETVISVFLGKVWWPVWSMTRDVCAAWIFFISINPCVLHFFILLVFIQEAWSWPSSLWLPSDHICCGAVVWWTNIWKIWRYFWKQSCPGFVFYGSSHELHNSWFGINCKHAVSVKTPFHFHACNARLVQQSYQVVYYGIEIAEVFHPLCIILWLIFDGLSLWFRCGECLPVFFTLLSRYYISYRFTP